MRRRIHRTLSIGTRSESTSLPSGFSASLIISSLILGCKSVNIHITELNMHIYVFNLVICITKTKCKYEYD